MEALLANPAVLSAALSQLKAAPGAAVDPGQAASAANAVPTGGSMVSKFFNKMAEGRDTDNEARARVLEGGAGRIPSVDLSMFK